MFQQGERLLNLAWHEPSLVTSEALEGYRSGFLAENWDRALWELTLASRASDLPERLQELTLPVLVITGDDDRIVPKELSTRLASELPNARLSVVDHCGHVPQEECPDAFLRLVKGFLSDHSSWSR
jgi:pimeloyl-ACP methyl ester carboxylesterase